MRGNNFKQLIGLIAVVIVLLVLPLRMGAYYVDVFILLFINVIIAVSFRVMATTGELSLAHMPLVGVGAYTTALLGKTFGLPFWLTLPLAGSVAALIGLAMSYPLVKTKGFAFFVASWAAGEAMRLSWGRFRNPFGGYGGLQGIPPPESIPIAGLQAIDFSRPIPYYYLTLGITMLCLLVMYRIDKSRIGLNFKAIQLRGNLAESIGIPIVRYKTLAFVITSFFAGIAGVLLAHRLWAIDPAQFGFITTLYLVAWVVVGGLNTFFGPIIGVSVLTVVSELLTPLAEWVPLIYGSILILTLRFLPDGLESLGKKMAPLIAKMPMIGRRS